VDVRASEDRLSGVEASSTTSLGGSSRRAEQVDITQLFSDTTDELLQRAAQQAAQWGSVDLNTEHLLHAALENGVVRRVLEGADADPDQIRAQLEEETAKEARKDAHLPHWPRTPNGRFWRPTRRHRLSAPPT